MPEKETIKVKVFRFDPSQDTEPYDQDYSAPWREGLSAMDVLDHIYHNLDSTLAYYDHAGCSLGICGRCTARINGKPGLLCQTLVPKAPLVLEPLNKDKVLKDLVMQKVQGKESNPETDSDDPKPKQNLEDVDLIVRREIEALIAVPFLKAFIEAFDEEKVLQVAKRVIRDLALQAGSMLRLAAGGNTLGHMKRALPLFSQGGALELEVLKADSQKTEFNITRCKYAEMYREHGMEEFGYLLGCGRDFALIEGFNPDIKFTRTQTIMQGAEFCDFRLEMKD